ncbi:MAG: hypothetical protein ACXACC_02560 [Promethearchaeota archaeon]|jgi:exonuclease VII small subunit
MTDKELIKLSKLCEHWANHNESHRENFEKWREKAEEKRLTEVVNNLNKAIEMMDNCNTYLLNAKKELDKLL